MNTIIHTATPAADLSSDLDVLEDLLTPAAADDFSDLNALLNESVAARHEAQLVKDKRRLLANNKIPAEERLGVEALIRSWEIRKEWIAVASTQMFSQQTCTACGGVHHHFLGLYQKQVSKVSKVFRWIKSDEVANKDLPTEAKLEESFAPVCADCSPAFEDA
jgi:hypothetical protein